jgi:hypothetical protein
VLGRLGLQPRPHTLHRTDAHRAEHLDDGGPQCLAPVQDDEHALLDVQAAVDEVGEQAPGDGLSSVEPSHRPSGTMTPSVVMPSATTQQRPLSSMPSSISPASRAPAGA